MRGAQDPVQYVLVRRDMTHEAQMVHVGHAAGESILVAPISKRTILRLLHVADEAELRAYHGRLVAKGFRVALVEETDGSLAGQATALGTEPSSERLNALGKLFWHLRPASSVPIPASAVMNTDPPPPPTDPSPAPIIE
jgi:hypothetical protein